MFLIYVIYRHIIEPVRQRFCQHDLEADKQITLVRCRKCQKEYWYRKGVDLFPKGERGKLNAISIKMEQKL